MRWCRNQTQQALYESLRGPPCAAQDDSIKVVFHSLWFCAWLNFFTATSCSHSIKRDFTSQVFWHQRTCGLSRTSRLRHANDVRVQGVGSRWKLHRLTPVARCYCNKRWVGMHCSRSVRQKICSISIVTVTTLMKVCFFTTKWKHSVLFSTRWKGLQLRL